MWVNPTLFCRVKVIEKNRKLSKKILKKDKILAESSEESFLIDTVIR